MPTTSDDNSGARGLDLRSVAWLIAVVLIGVTGVGYAVGGLGLALVNIVVGLVILTAICVRIGVSPPSRTLSGRTRSKSHGVDRLAMSVGLGAVASVAGLVTLWLTSDSLALPMGIAAGVFLITGLAAVVLARRRSPTK